MNEPVNLDIARLLNQKGFNESCDDYWQEGLRSSTPDEWKLNYYAEAATDSIKALTIIQIVMWIYKTHNIWISVTQKVERDSFFWSILTPNSDIPTYSVNNINDPEFAYKEAILYILTYVI